MVLIYLFNQKIYLIVLICFLFILFQIEKTIINHILFYFVKFIIIYFIIFSIFFLHKFKTIISDLQPKIYLLYIFKINCKLICLI